jgi:dipeptidyl aminopeptidase/acylaminoacyl peptidase
MTAAMLGCGGGGGGDGTPADGGGGTLNGGLGGSMLYTTAGDAVRLNVASGAVVSAELDADSAGQLGFGGGIASDVTVTTHVTSQPTEYNVQLLQLSGSPLQPIETLPTISASGLLVSGPVQPSSNGRLFALHTRESADLGSPYVDNVYVIDKSANVHLHATGYRDPVWLDAQTVIAAGDDGLFKLQVDTGAATRIGAAGLGAAGAQPAQPALSPDGRSIVFAQNNAIWRIGVDGSGLTQLSQQGLPQAWPAWSPDGARVAVARGSCPVSGTGDPEPDVVVLSAGAANQDIEHAAALQRQGNLPVRTCGPLYWLP